MVGIETTNYTFFILKKFDWLYIVSFGYSGILGILITHVFKVALSKNNLFSRNKAFLWVLAGGSSVVISILMLVLSELPALILTEGQYLQMIYSPIYFFAGVINWLRYIGGWVVIYFMYRLIEQNNLVNSQRMQSESIAKSAQLELLKTQLNPHFLFNALNSIKALVLLDPKQSRDAIVKLSELLRFTLNYGQEKVIPLFDEIQEVKKYLSLEQIRFGDRLSIEYELDESAYSKLVPPTLILTLAENAIKHGVAKKVGPGIVRIIARLDNNDLYLIVANTGQLTNERSSGIGLNIIQKRLEAIFQTDARFGLYRYKDFVNAEIIIRHEDDNNRR